MSIANDSSNDLERLLFICARHVGVIRACRVLAPANNNRERTSGNITDNVTTHEEVYKTR